MEEKIDIFLYEIFGQIYLQDIRDMLLILDSQKTGIGIVSQIYTDHTELGWKITSLFLEFIIQVEKLFNIEINDLEMGDIITFTQLKDTIKQKIKNVI